MDNNSIKKNIINLRNKSGLTQTEMASRLGISRTAYRNLENGRTNLLSSSVAKIANVFATSPEEVVLGYHPVEGDSQKLRDVQKEYLTRRRKLEEEYETKMADLRTQNETLQEYVDALKEIIRTKDEIIAMLKSYDSK